MTTQPLARYGARNGALASGLTTSVTPRSGTRPGVGVIPGSCRSCPKNANGAPHPCRSDHEREASTMRWPTVSI